MSIAKSLEELLVKDEVRDAMARYARGIDRRDEELVKSAYHEDSWDDHGWGLSASGPEIASKVRPGGGFPPWSTTQHFLGQHLIEVDPDLDHATSEVYFQAIMRHEDPDGVSWDMASVGRYLDQWERRDGELRIARRAVVYDYGRTDANRTPWPGPDHDVPKMIHGSDGLLDPAAYTVHGTDGADDPSYALLRLPSSADAG
jgi:hypothetical protein